MKKTIFILLMCLCMQLMHSQNRWSIGLSYQSGVSGLIKPTQNAFPVADSINVYKGTAYSHGICGNLIYKISDHFSLRSGINIFKTGFLWQWEKSFYTAEEQQISRLLDPAADKWEKSTAHAQYNFIEIPFIMQFSVKPLNKINISFDIGIALNNLIKFKSSRSAFFTDSIVKQDFQTTKFDKSEKYYLSSISGVRINYSLNKNMDFSVNPQFQYFFRKSSDAIISGNLYRMNLNVGLIYNFK